MDIEKRLKGIEEQLNKEIEKARFVPSVQEETSKRSYNRFDVTNPPKEYRFTARMSGECGKYLNEKAWRERTTITKIIENLIIEDMNRNPELFN